jgi:hypothetical protein
MSIGSMSSDGASRTGAGTTSGAGIKVVRTPGDWKSAEEMTAREQLATVESMEQIEARSADP